MSSPLAIAGVTAVLKDLLNVGLGSPPDLSSLGTVTVTALPPDRITTGTTEPNQVNLFLYLVSPNQGWRNVGLPSRNGEGEHLTNHPLVLNLHYLITAYGSDELHGEILLGRAMQILHETPVPSRQAVRSALAGPLLPSGSLMADDLADQAELIKISPQSLSSEEMSKLWTAFQAKYRPSAGYMVSVVLIESTGAVKTPLPVLKRGKEDRGVKATTGRLPFIEAVRFDRGKPAAELGAVITVSGQSFVGDEIEAILSHQRLGDRVPSLLVTQTDEQNITVTVPNASQAVGTTTVGETWPAGFYSLRLVITRMVDNEAVRFETNEYPLALAPKIVNRTPANAAAGNVTVEVTVQPSIQPRQRVSLMFGSREVQAPAVSAVTGKVAVTVPSVPPGTEGEYLVRVRIDGVDSIPLKAVPAGTLPQFDENQIVKVT
ncbi:MAG: DUF4255 domain-containing protein [Nitrospira sp.]|nr:DUF4255 domain-containing protein [Nitrospira sp.]